MANELVLSGESIAVELRRAWTSTSVMNDFLDHHLTRHEQHNEIPSSYTSECERIEGQCKTIFGKLPRFSRNGLRIDKNDGRDHPWVERFAYVVVYLKLV
jgi:hypothetical protein